MKTWFESLLLLVVSFPALFESGPTVVNLEITLAVL
ncbi:hypothetical protein OROMI_010026 [Orobanche minor]